MGHAHTGYSNARMALAFLILLAASAMEAGAALKIHLYSPWLGDPLRSSAPAFIAIQGSPNPGYPGVEMTPEGGDWYSYTFTMPTEDWNQFRFVNFIPDGNGKFQNPSEFRNGTSVDFTIGTVFTGSLTEVWVIPQGLGKPPVLTDIPPVRKVLLFFNPWPQAAPSIKLGAGTSYARMRLSQDPLRCGWYVHYFQDSAYSVHFKNLRGSEVYGKAGMGDAAPIDLAGAFKASDTLYLAADPLPGGPPRILHDFPYGIAGTCSFPLAVTVRDFSSKHPDFEEGTMNDALTRNMVLPVLDSTKKPRQGPVSYHQKGFQKWFRDDSANADPDLRNYTACRDLPMSKDRDGYWSYSSIEEPRKGFWPVDDLNRFGETYKTAYNPAYDPKKLAFNPDSTPKANFHFCMEMHAHFKYEKGQVFSFIGDDDVWVYINDKLTIDLGGTHSPQTDTVRLDTLGLAVGKQYDFDLFYCERHTSGSNLFMQTGIFFEQDRSIFGIKTPRSGGKEHWDIFEVVSGDQSCTSAKDGDTLPAASVFKIYGPSVNPAAVLPAGLSYGGILVDSGLTGITIDTSVVKGLKPGVYTVTFISKQSGKGNTLQFTVPVTELPPAGKPFSDPASMEFSSLSKGVTVSLATNTPGAAILYTTDGSMPDTAVTATTLGYLPGTPIALTGTTVLKAIAVKAGMAPSEVMVETYTRVVPAAVALPAADPRGKTFLEPLTVRLATATPGALILYTLDGSEPAAAAGGATHAYGDPIVLENSAVLKAMAVKDGLLPSPVLTETYAFTRPVAARGGWFLDADGDGRIDGAVVEFAGGLGANLPGRLAFRLQGADGLTETRIAEDTRGQIERVAGSPGRLAVGFAPPFPFGLTAVADPASAGQAFRQENVPILDALFPMSDSVAPVILAAAVTYLDSGANAKRLTVALSEAVGAGLDGNAFVFKRGGEELATGAVTLRPAGGSGKGPYVLYVDSASALYPIPGDSIALVPTGLVKDAHGNAPARKLFVALTGTVPKAKPVEIYVTFPKGGRQASAGSVGASANVLFVPVDALGNPLPGMAGEGKCPGCFVGGEADFAGPVIHMEVPGPASYEFKLFDNLGAFVASGRGRINETDILALGKTGGGLRHLARVVWTGRTAKGGSAGTGAYILAARVRLDKDPRTGAPAGTESRKLVFGLVRPTGS